jgi:Ca-activated chloride channel family protein
VVDPDLTPLLAALGALILGAAAELWHARRIRRLATLKFGPGGKPAAWVRAAAPLGVLALGALAWGLATLALIEPRHHGQGESNRGTEFDHVLLVLDVSPSMRLQDAGPTRKQSRMARARDVLTSFFNRVPIERYRVSVVAVYNGAKPVVVDTKDFEVVRNILGDLPMQYAFQAGKTKLFDGLEEAARVAKPWNPRSTTLLLVSDGDTVPGSGMPKMPSSIGGVLVVGVGDPFIGKFIDGRQSRQDSSTLKQIAARLSGSFHDGNEKQIATSLIAEVTGASNDEPWQKLTRREYALMACAAGAGLMALLPILLHYLGTRFRPGLARTKENAPVAGAGARDLQSRRLVPSFPGLRQGGSP